MRKRSLSELNRLSVAEFKSRPKTPLTLVLDNVRSALNVGSAFRTADAFAIEQIFLCGITAQPPTKEINKTALGATETIAWTYAPDPAEVVQQLQSNGYQVLAIEQAEGSIQLQDFVPLGKEKYALVFGNEVNGVSESVMNLVNNCIEIPQFGTKHSLNISVCVGIVVWELFIKILNAK